MQVINTKLLIPPLRAKLVERAALIRKLNQGIECGFVLVSAPAGYGKSTLLSTWLSQSNLSCAWLSLDTRDNELARFLTYLSSAFQTVDPSINQFLDAEVDSNAQPDIELLLTPFVNHLTQDRNPLCLILDDYHVIQNPLVHQAICFLIEHRPTTLCLVISTRADPPLPLTRLRAHSAILEVRQADLCFSTQEAEQFLSNTMGLQVSPEDITHITTRTEGWIAGLQMAGLSLQGKTDISTYIHSFSGENRFVLDFLFDEVFQRQPMEFQQFLIQTSILERFCGPLCDAVTQRNNSQSLLESLHRSNLFLLALDEQKEWYRYHNLFAELLKIRLMQTDAQSIALLHQRASAWYAEKNDLENAIAHALAAPDYEHAANLIELVLQNLDLINRQPLLSSWIDNLPDEIQIAHPWLCAYRAYGDYWTGHRERAEEWLQKAERSSAKTFDDGSVNLLRIQGYIASVRAHTALGQEDIPFALEMAKKALDILPEGDMMHTTTGIALGAAYWAAGDVIQAERAFATAQMAGMKTNDSFAVAPICYRGIQQIKRGRLETALATFHEGLRLATQPDGHETAIAGFPNTKLGDVLRQRNELGMASQHLHRGLEQCLRLQQVDFLADAYVCLGRYQLAIGDLESAFESIQKADRLSQHAKIDQWVLCWLDDLRLRSWLANGDLEATIQWAKTSGIPPEAQLSYLHDLHHQNLARVLVAQCTLEHSQDTYKLAAGLLSRLLDATAKAGWVHEEIIIRVLQAINEQVYGKTESALQSLTHAVSLAQPGGYVRVFLDEGGVMQHLLSLLADRLKNDQSLNIQQQQLSAVQGYVAMLLSTFQRNSLEKGQSPTSQSVFKPAPILFPRDRVRQTLVEPLSSRELELLRLLALGYPDKKIAEALVISSQTVHKHLKNIYGKLGVHSRTEAVAHARELNLL